MLPALNIQQRGNREREEEIRVSPSLGCDEGMQHNLFLYCDKTDSLARAFECIGWVSLQCLLIGEIISLNTFKVSFVIITNMIYKENLRIYFTILDECFSLCKEKVYRHGYM